jgi:hypothetical protein
MDSFPQMRLCGERAAGVLDVDNPPRRGKLRAARIMDTPATPQPAPLTSLDYETAIGNPGGSFFLKPGARKITPFLNTVNTFLLDSRTFVLYNESQVRSPPRGARPTELR